MATTLFDNVVDSNKVWRGAARFLWAPSGTSFPGKLESVIQPRLPNDPHKNAYALGSAWTDFGGTTEDGLTIMREFEGTEGIPVDQLGYDLFEGDPDNWRMRVSSVLLRTDPATLAIAWELPATTSIVADATGPDYKVAQTKAVLNAPKTLTERLLAIVQQHPSRNDLRVFVFRKAKLTPEARETVIKSSAGSSVPVAFDCQGDTSVSDDDGPFGVLFEQD